MYYTVYVVSTNYCKLMVETVYRIRVTAVSRTFVFGFSLNWSCDSVGWNQSHQVYGPGVGIT